MAQIDQVEVTQADREVAASLIFGHYYKCKIRAGEFDYHPYCQAFARHRIASEEAAVLRGVKDASMPWHTVALDKAILGLMKAGNALSFAAQTSGGTAGRDDHLRLAIIHWETELGKVEQIRRIVRLEWDDPEIGAGILALDPQAIAKDATDDD